MLRIFLAAFLISVAAGAPALARSLALVIGNDSYVSIPKLAKARSDASGYADFFRARGFETDVHTDLDSKSALIAVAAFLDKIEPGDTVAFVFSGHGWSDGSENYLLPIDVSATSSQTLFKHQSMTVQNGVNGVVDEIVARGARLTLIVIDACRNNPFNSKDRTRSIGLSRGLTTEVAPEGTFIAFSAGAGQTALDALSDKDPSPYSVFTRNFLEQLKKPQDLQSAFKATQLKVSELARGIGHDQRPAYYDEVVGKACLTDNCGGVVLPATGASGGGNKTTDANESSRLTRAIQTWEHFKDSDDPVALEAFAEEFDDTPFAALARSRIRDLTGEPEPPTRSEGKGEPEGDTNTAVLPPERPERRERDRDVSTDGRPDWCPRASTPTEIAVCMTPALSRLDLTLSRLFRRKRDSTSNDLALEALRQDQRDWIRARNRCGSQRRCVERQYRRRIDQLRY